MVNVNQQVAPGFVIQTQQTCPVCGGKGHTYKEACPHCHGNKVVNEDKVLDVVIEKGMPSDYQVRFERASKQTPGMIPGDVVFDLKLKPHYRFTRQDKDLYMDLKISLKEALLGFSKTFHHMDQHSVTVTNKDEVSKPFQVIDMKGEGMPVHNYPSEFGDLHVKLLIQYPKSLTDEQKKKINENL